MDIAPTIPTDVSATIDRRAARRMEKLTRFAKDPDSIGKVPAPLRKPFNLKSWRALPEDVRLQHLTKKVREQLTAEELAKLQYRQELNAARAAVSESARKRATLAVVKAPSPAALRRRLVACVAGCGEFHPAPSYKPALIACGGWQSTAKRKPGSVFNASVDRDGTEYLIRKLKAEAEEARRATSSGTKARKQERKPKPRRRAVCSNTK